MITPDPAQTQPVLVWFRRDLRLADNPALAAAADSGRPVLALFIQEDGQGAAVRWWLHHSLIALSAALAAHGVRLVLRQGDPEALLPDLVRLCGASAVHWNRLYEPVAAARDERLRRRLADQGIDVRDFNAGLLFEPWTVQSRSGEPFRVFANFRRACLTRAEPEPPRSAPSRLVPFTGALPNNPAPTLPSPDGPESTCEAGEAAAACRLEMFLDRGLSGYTESRERPDQDGTSRLSPHLRWGEIGPRQIWHALAMRAGHVGTRNRKDLERFQTELCWREFAYHLLHHNPGLADRPLRREFEHFPWNCNAGIQGAWQRGQTGYPIVDAGMRELKATGWIHNRVRMIVASFLVKHLLQPWQAGAAWFLDRLVDADLASNALGWQWVTGCGVDAASWFRIFNPVLQGQRHDPDGAYVRRWLPELAKLPAEVIHRPWQAPPLVLADAKVRLGRIYPRPIVEHGEARRRALTAMYELRDRARARLI